MHNNVAILRRGISGAWCKLGRNALFCILLGMCNVPILFSRGSGSVIRVTLLIKREARGRVREGLPGNLYRLLLFLCRQ